MTKYTIYCHIHIESGRRYIGLTKMSMMKRWNRHVYSVGKLTKKNGKSHFHNAIRKYGKDAFRHEVLEICYSLEEANAAEKKWIAHFDTRNPEKGFNLAPGGSHTPHPVKNPWERPGYKEKVSSAIKERWKDPIIRAQNAAASAAALRTSKVRSRCSKSQKGKILSQKHCEKISANMIKFQHSKSRDELSEQSRNMNAGRHKRRKSMTEKELSAARKRHSEASKSANKILATQTPAAITAHKESCRRRSKYASIDIQAVLSMLEKGITKTNIARELNVDRGTLHRALNRV